MWNLDNPLYGSRKLEIGSPCFIYDNRKRNGVVPGENDQTLIKGTCQYTKNCPAKRPHFGTPIDCTTIGTSAVCCLDQPVTCLNVAASSGTCRNSDVASNCKDGQFLDPGPDICPTGYGKEKIQCCKPNPIRPQTCLPTNDEVYDPLQIGLLPGITNSYQLQEITNRISYLPQQGTNSLQENNAQISDGNNLFPIPPPQGTVANLFDTKLSENDNNQSPGSTGSSSEVFRDSPVNTFR
ncbi:hypothetical protein MMC22_009609 [Lobaria immixta]|nr:hypothetical protein [Lobaria immixta]